MRIDNMITQEKMTWSFIKILSPNSLRKCIEIGWKNLYMDTGA